MLRASALYIVIIIALVVATLCSSMIVAAYFYKLQYQRKFRLERLQNNLESGISLILSSDSNYYSEKKINLFYQQEDTISIEKISWGFFDVGIVKAYFQRDTLYKSFSIASAIDSLKWASIYLVDEERPLYVSGKTYIKGTAYLPKSGIKESYVEGNSYEGDKRLVIGDKRESKEILPMLKKSRINYLRMNKESFLNSDSSFKGKIIKNSFLNPAMKFYFKNVSKNVSNINLEGNIILFSENGITLDSTCFLNNVLVFAKSIQVRNGFKGSAQLFATESIIVGKNCVFNYPSGMGVLKTDTKTNIQPKIVIGDSCVFKGILFSYEKVKSDAQTLIDLGKDVRIEGEVFSKGMIRFKNGVTIYGGISANRIIYETKSTLFENYLVNTTINLDLLSPYYLTSNVFSGASNKRKVLEWLGTK